LFCENVGADIIRLRLPEIRPRLTDVGRIIDGAINNISRIYSCVAVDRYVIMPDHVHLILVVERGSDDGRMISAPTVTVSKLPIRKMGGRETMETNYDDSRVFASFALVNPVFSSRFYRKA
jgi:REP element-mobilizing transposase RayT